MKSEMINLGEALLLTSDLEKTGRLKSIEYYDEKDRFWSKKELEKLSKVEETEPKDIIIYVDGGFDAQKKIAGIGIIIHFKQHNKAWRIRHNEQMNYLSDNNEAELAAMFQSMALLEEIGATHQSIIIRSDSKVATHQASGKWPCYEDHYNAWLDRLDKKKAALNIEIVFEEIDRKENKEADHLATQALSGVKVSAKKQL